MLYEWTKWQLAHKWEIANIYSGIMCCRVCGGQSKPNLSKWFLDDGGDLVLVCEECRDKIPSNFEPWIAEEG